MNDQVEQIGFEASEFAENPEPRVPCVLLLDTSGSMAEVVANTGMQTGRTIRQDGKLYRVVSGGTTRIDLLNEGLVILRDTLAADTLASRRAEIAIVSFGGSVTTIQDFVTAEQSQPPSLEASGGTPMGRAIGVGLDMIARRKAVYQRNGVPYYRPWIFLITDGEPDRGDPWQDVATRVKQGEAAGSFAFFSVGVEGADLDVLAQIATRTPVKLKGLNFRELFLWLSRSMQSVSQSSPGDRTALPPPGWADI